MKLANKIFSISYRFVIVSAVGVASLSLLCETQSFAEERVSPSYEWSQRLPIDPRLIQEMGRFGGLSDWYRGNLAKNTRTRMIDEVERMRQNFARGECNPTIRVDFMRAGFADPQGREPGYDKERDFENGFVRTEVVACLPESDPQRVLNVMSSPNFRREAVKELSKSQRDGNTICENTKSIPFLLGETRSCAEIQQMTDGPLAIALSSVAWNDGDSRVQPVFFREGLTLVYRQRGRTAVHYVGYARVKAAGLGEGIAKGKIRDAQERFYSLLSQRVR